MKTTVVPAQVTTVEDKIAGSLGLTQLLLLITPVFTGSALFVILPPFFAYATYKIVLIVCLATLCGVLSIRIKGKILLLWVIAILRYNTRSRYYVFDKNETHLRDIEQTAVPEETDEEVKPKETIRVPLSPLNTADIVQIESIITNPAANMHIKTNRKGELHVHITEIK